VVVVGFWGWYFLAMGLVAAVKRVAEEAGALAGDSAANVAGAPWFHS
jgi:hypothetical protein